ncbi:hypothetical protein SAMN04487820_10293 [Actinopolyspora mzabensis]|uniref:Uncharacterized protein n=1 Tax=Actinopolyspora mzabensis TaxID=995066 RepID=A0A1G8WKS2_ACTMZ|nr:DUF6319 family protein [Actinopolyspora mzabensis]SDJ78771.1 hypothetical protein SAMN04487820_10293 [Actinopolyspora mzabensis]
MNEQQNVTDEQTTAEQDTAGQNATDQEAGEQDATNRGVADQSATDQGDTERGDTDRGTENAEANNGNAEQGTQKKTKGRKQTGARKTRQVELTLTVSGTAEGEWQADLTHAGKKIVQGLPISASSVSKAAGELHDDISEAIESVLSEARQQHEARLAELEAELQRVRKTLEELES